MLRTHFSRSSHCRPEKPAVPATQMSGMCLCAFPTYLVGRAEGLCGHSPLLWLSWNAAPLAQTRQWERVSLFARIGVNSVLPWLCFSATPVLVNPILLLTDIFLNATVIGRTKGECSEMFLEAGCKGQVNGYLCANTDSDPYGAARAVESIAIICSHGTGWHNTEMTWNSAVSSLCLISH